MGKLGNDSDKKVDETINFFNKQPNGKYVNVRFVGFCSGNLEELIVTRSLPPTKIYIYTLTFDIYSKIYFKIRFSFHVY